MNFLKREFDKNQAMDTGGPLKSKPVENSIKNSFEINIVSVHFPNGTNTGTSMV